MEPTKGGARTVLGVLLGPGAQCDLIFFIIVYEYYLLYRSWKGDGNRRCLGNSPAVSPLQRQSTSLGSEIRGGLFQL